MAQKEKLCFVGFRFAGKTTFGRALADIIGLKFIDIDELIVQRAGKSISKIFQTDGAAYFRLLEEKIISEVFNYQDPSMLHSIIAVGGGALDSSKNRKIIQENAFVVYLEVAESELLNRYMVLEQKKDDFRPRLTQLSMDKEFIFLLQQRKPYYSEISDVTISLDKPLIEENLTFIISVLKTKGPEWLRWKI